MTTDASTATPGREQSAERRNALHGWRTMAFASPSFALTAMLLPVLMYLPDYYARDLGVDLAVVAFVLTTVRIADIAFDPVLGLMMDRSHPRTGRYRTWFVCGIPLAAIAIYMLYNAPVGVSGAYLFLWLAAANVGQSVSYLAHISWAASAARSYDHRSNIFGWLMVFSVLGMFLIMALPPVLSLTLGWERPHAVQSMGWLMIASLPLTALLAIAAVGEPPRRPMLVRPSRQELFALLRRGLVVRLIAADIVWGIGPSVAAALLFAFFDSLKLIERDLAGLALLAYFIGGMLGAPIWVRIAKRTGKHRALLWSGLTYAVVQSAILLVPAGNVPLALVGMAIAGLPSNAGPILIRSMMADVADEVRLATGVDRLSLLLSLLSSIGKIGPAVMTGLALYALSLADFDIALGARNNTESLWLLGFLYAIVPAATGLLTAWVIRGYRLDATTHADICRQLDERDRTAEREAETPEPTQKKTSLASI